MSNNDQAEEWYYAALIYLGAHLKKVQLLAAYIRFWKQKPTAILFVIYVKNSS